MPKTLKPAPIRIAVRLTVHVQAPGVPLSRNVLIVPEKRKAA